MTRLIALLLMVAPGAAAAQDLVIPRVRYPALPAAAPNAGGFAPRGWRVEAQAAGDLNGDGVADLALVLRMNDPANVLVNDGMGNNPFDTNPRILAVAFAAPGGAGYRLALQNHALIPRRDSPTQEDWFGGDNGRISLARGALRVSLWSFMNAGGWDAGTRVFTFRWREVAFRLVGYDDSSLRRNSGDTSAISINYLTGRIRTARGNNEHVGERICRTRISARGLPTIDRVGNGMEFDPEGFHDNMPEGSGRYCPGRR